MDQAQKVQSLTAAQDIMRLSHEIAAYKLGHKADAGTVPGLLGGLSCLPAPPPRGAAFERAG